jgi:molybdopterin converting factor subunit 1
MILRVRLFARARDLGGADTLSVEVPAGATVADLRRGIAVVAPALAALVTRCAVAVNSDFADDSRTLGETDEVALLPPVSGG